MWGVGAVTLTVWMSVGGFQGEAQDFCSLSLYSIEMLMVHNSRCWSLQLLLFCTDASLPDGKRVIQLYTASVCLHHTM